MKFLLLASMAIFSLLITTKTNAQAKPGKVAKQKATTKKDKPEEFVIIEDSVIRTTKDHDELALAQKDLPVAVKPEIDFDTSFIAADVFTVEIRQLLEETGVINLGRSVAKVGIQNLQKANTTNTNLDTFCTRFLLALDSKEFELQSQYMYIRLYRKNFTPDDMHQLQAFYRTPIGKKSLQKLPEVMSSAMAEGSKLGKYMAGNIIYNMEQEKNNS